MCEALEARGQLGDGVVKVFLVVGVGRIFGVDGDGVESTRIDVAGFAGARGVRNPLTNCRDGRWSYELV